MKSLVLPILLLGLLHGGAAAKGGPEKKHDEPWMTALKQSPACLVWEKPYLGVGISSPRLADLNGDGIKDIALGTDLRGNLNVLAISGSDGTQLWEASVNSIMVGTGIFSFVNADPVPDFIIGTHRGFRLKYLDIKAFDGTNGSLLWSLRRENSAADLPDSNFNSLCPTRDLDGDGIVDLVVVQAGGIDDEFDELPGWDDSKRLAGRIHFISPVSGKILKTFVSFDGKESYCTPAVMQNGDVIVGSGGETVPGHLARLSFDNENPAWAVPSKEKGFESSPFVYTFDDELGEDIVAANMDGDHLRLDGDTGDVLWRFSQPGYECTASPAPGLFNGSPGMDVVGAVTQGVFPDYNQAAHLIWLDGKTGALIARMNYGKQISASLLTIDLDMDGYHEVVVITNFSYNLEREGISSELAILDGRTREFLFRHPMNSMTVATPVIDDVDSDGTLDLILVTAGIIKRFALNHHPAAKPLWNQFRGPDENGFLRPGS